MQPFKSCHIVGETWFESFQPSRPPYENGTDEMLWTDKAPQQHSTQLQELSVCSSKALAAAPPLSPAPLLWPWVSCGGGWDANTSDLVDT